MEFAKDANHIGSILQIHPESPGRQTNLPILMRIGADQKRSPRLAATSLRNISPLKHPPLGRKLI
ncbi:uncharacterized protein METZ01_LOCUS509227 [marine metagenome]|uniref:Uncharacterized protein n=1 Tax=marine metagenome TaxID=408172 RepID=A0A383EIW6_9ZZZZ